MTKTDPLATDEMIEAALERFKLATEAVETAKGELEASRAALAEAHDAAAVEPDLEDWREAHAEFCLAAGYCFTRGSTDCATRARIAGLKAAAPHILAMQAKAPATSPGMREACVAMVSAWESLPGPKHYSAHEIQCWMRRDLKPAIDGLRAALSQSSSPVEVGGEARPRYHVEGQTAPAMTGPRWQIWDNVRHFARFQNIADEGDAQSICDELNALSLQTKDNEEDVERVARAICRVDECDPDDLEPGNTPFGDDQQFFDGTIGVEPAYFLWRNYVCAARAAISALSGGR